MIQLNLLPDVKLEYIKAQRMRRLVISVSVLVTAASVVLLVLLLGVGGLQKKHMSDLNDDITSKTNQLKNKPDIDKILTVQNQLGSLTALHASKPAASRVFDFINQTTPSSVSINEYIIDFTTQEVTISGGADALSSVNKYVDTLKFTTYSDGTTQGTKAFNNVVLNSFGINGSSGQSSQSVIYEIKLNYDPAIFDITKDVTLSVPSVTTHAGVTDLFQSNGGVQ
jgi:hypothetical protein